MKEVYASYDNKCPCGMGRAIVTINQGKIFLEKGVQCSYCGNSGKLIEGNPQNVIWDKRLKQTLTADMATGMTINSLGNFGDSLYKQLDSISDYIVNAIEKDIEIEAKVNMGFYTNINIRKRFFDAVEFFDVAKGSDRLQKSLYMNGKPGIISYFRNLGYEVDSTDESGMIFRFSWFPKKNSADSKIANKHLEREPWVYTPKQ